MEKGGESFSADGDSVPRPGRIAKVRAFLYDTWYGMAAVWCAVGLVVYVLGCAFGDDGRISGFFIVLFYAHLLALTPLALSAPVVSLCRRRWGRACAQVGAGALAGLLYLAGMLAVAAVSLTMEKSRCKDQSWKAMAISDALPFAVEYRPMHPFLAEYEIRLAFRSGRHVPLRPDTGGAGKFAIHAVGTNVFHLVDQGNMPMHTEYRVDVARETVEVLCGGDMWVPLSAEKMK